MNWRDQLAAIMLDHVEGASGLTQATARMLVSFLDEENHTSVQSLSAALQELARQILTAQSGMASLVTLFNRVFFALGTADDIDLARRQIRSQLGDFQERLASHRQACSRLAAALIAPDTVVMTHSASSIVADAILRAVAGGCAVRVVATESRPLYEGRRLAERLAAAGVDVTLIVDAAAYANLAGVGMILLGTDSLTPPGVVSKIGSAGLAVCARTMDVPCYFLADLSRIWPAALGEQPIHERAPVEVWPESPPGVRVQNRFYDLTPWSAVYGIVTENGLLSPVQVQRLCHEQEAHPLLEEIVATVRSSV